MKESIYNIKLRYGKHNIIFNTRTSKVMPVSEFTSGIERSNVGSADRSLQNLYNGGFVVEDSVDEFAEVCAARYKNLFDPTKIVLTLMMSYSCNLDCLYCCEHSKKANTNMTEEVVGNVLSYIENKIANNHIESVKLKLFGGEPLCNIKGCIDVVNRAKVLCNKNNVKFKLHITTNGTIVTKPLLDALKDIDVSFQITIDGSAKTHDKKRYYINGKGTYNIIIKNLNLLYDHLPQAQFTIRTNYDNDVLDTIPDLLGDIMRMKSRCRITLRKIFQLRDNEIDEKKLDRAIALINRMGLVVTCYGYSFGLHCKSTLKNYYVINYDGRIKKCQAFQREEGVIGMLNGCDINLNKYVDVEKDIMKLPEKCKKCKLFPICLGPCYRTLADSSRFHCNLQSLYKIVSFMVKQKFVANYAKEQC